MSELSSAIKQICEEKGLSYDAVITTIESALAAAYRKDFGQKNQNIKIEFDAEKVKSKIFDVKTVVEDMPEDDEITEGEGLSDNKEAEQEKKDSQEKPKIKDQKSKVDDDKEEGGEGAEEDEVRKFNPKTEIQITDAKLVKKTAKVGDEIKTKLEAPEGYGRMAAQTAKQVIIQRLREAEREMIYNDFKTKEHEVVSGVVQRKEGRVVLIDLGKTVGVLPQDEMISGEFYKAGDRIKVYVKSVEHKAKGPEIILSRTSEEILKKVFYLEIPEIANGLIELKAVAREAGFRSKVAVFTDSDNVDPIGSCVGQRGARIQTIITELGGEKVDIIEYDEDPNVFIANALSPAKIIGINIDEEEEKALVRVAEDQLSLAIGKGGQNARLAAKLTGWKIDIIEDGKERNDESKIKDQEPEDKEEKKDEGEPEKEVKGKKEEKKPKTKKKEKEEEDGDKEEKSKKKKSKISEKEKQEGAEEDEDKEKPKKTKKEEKDS